MKKIALILLAMLSTQVVLAKGIEASEAYARATVGQKTSGAFVTLKNKTLKDDVLLGVSVDKELAEMAQLHTHINDNGTMRMRELRNGLPLPAGKTQELKPGGYHIMLFGLKHDLKVGKQFPITLKFKHAGEEVVHFTVQQIQQQQGHHQNHANHHH